MSFDLNIANYTKQELAEMFELSGIYDAVTIQQKETKLKDSILTNNELSKEMQMKTLEFISKAKTILLGQEQQQQQQQQQQEPFKPLKDFFNSSYELKMTQTVADDHEVQVRKDKPYLSSFPSEYFPGVINPLKKRTTKRNLNIDTRFRENYYGSPSTNFNMQLPTTFNDVLSMQLAAIELPTTYYNVSKQMGNNFFTIVVNDMPGVVTIPSGNYKYDAITAVINSALTNLGDPFDKIVFEVNLSANNGSGQMLVGAATASVADITSITLNFQADRNGDEDRNTPLPLKLGWLIGFRNGIYENNLNYVSEGIVDIVGQRYMYLVVDDRNNNVNNSFYSAFNSSILNKNILARITLHAPNFSVFTENNLNLVTVPRDYFGPVNLQNMTIQLLDEYGRIVDLNNMDFSFCLTLTTVYDI
jgi:hypothetical protein